MMMVESHDTRELESNLATIVKQVEELVGVQDFERAIEALDGLTSSDRLIVLSRLSDDIRGVLLLGIDAQKAAVYLHDIPDAQTLGLLESLHPDDAAKILSEIPKDEQATYVRELKTNTQESILSGMERQSAEEVRELIDFGKDEAGGMMIVEFVSVPLNWSVGDVTTKLQKDSSVFADYDVQYIYVVDQSFAHAGKLVGVLRLRDLVMSPATTRIDSLMIREPLSVNVEASLKDLNQLFLDHRFLGVPVVDDEDQLLGILRRTDVEKAVSERYADAYMKSQGIVDEELRTMPVGVRSRRRLAWLSINIVLNLIAASVIAFYQDTLEQVIALAVFLPIISDMSGCSGSQAVAVSMRELALGLIRPIEVWRVWLKEIGVGIMNGFCLGLLVGLVALVWKGNLALGVVVGAAMMFNTMVAVSLGGVLPLIMRLMKIDPALASGPILTTITDMCGFFLVLSLASIWLENLI